MKKKKKNRPKMNQHKELLTGCDWLSLSGTAPGYSGRAGEEKGLIISFLQ